MIRKFSLATATLLSGLLAGCFPFGGDDSSDSITWTQRASSSQVLNDVDWSGTLAVAVGDSGTILTSPDGLTWTKRDVGTPNALVAVAWTGSRLIGVGLEGIRTAP